MQFRIVLFGQPAAGKTTLGKKLAELFKISFVEGSSALQPFGSREEAREKHMKLQEKYGDGVIAKINYAKAPSDVVLTGRGIDNALYYKQKGFLVIFLDSFYGRLDVNKAELDEEEKIYSTSQIKNIADVVLCKDELERQINIILNHMLSKVLHL